MLHNIQYEIKAEYQWQIGLPLVCVMVGSCY
jgi:hypothetical protein